MSEHKDAVLVARARSGDPEAVNELVRQYWRTAYNHALHILRRHEDAEDVAQESLLSAVAHLGAFNERAAFGTWLHRIVFNQSIMLLRRKRSCALDLAFTIDDQLQKGLGQLQKGLGQVQASPERQTMDAERYSLLNAALERLPNDYRVPLWLYTYKEQSVSDIAQNLSLSTSGVKIRLHRARKMLSKKTVRISRQMSAPVAAAA